jgi:hypothetical protein
LGEPFFDETDTGPNGAERLPRYMPPRRVEWVKPTED